MNKYLCEFQTTIVEAISAETVDEAIDLMNEKMEEEHPTLSGSISANHLYKEVSE